MSDRVRRLSILAFGLSLVLCTLLPGPPAEAKGGVGWTQWRGPSDGGPTVGAKLPDKSFGLTVAWDRELGSGFSGIWPVDGKILTAFTSGDVDVVAAFDAGSGDERWRYELGEKYPGHDGSSDGPLAVPVVRDGIVYVLGPRGVLAALALKDGSEKWRLQLGEEDSTEPFYGYTTSPVVTSKLVIVATGGEGHAVTAFDRKSGKTVWTAGDDSVNYQTPMLLELGGREVLLTLTDHYLMGIDPADGKILWQLQHSEGQQIENSAHATPLDGTRFLVRYNAGARLYRVTGDGVEEVWQTRAFGNGLALPVLIGDHFYGFSGTVMTCVAADTGEIVWRTRDVSGFGLAEVDGRIAVLSTDGALVLIDPSPEGYRELTRVAVFDQGSYPLPTFADGMLVVRNLQRMAAVRIDTSLAPEVAETDTADRHLGEFGTWVASVEALPESERQAAVESRFAAVESTPLIGDDGLVHLVWRGDAEDVAIRGDVAVGVQELGMYQVPGTDLFYRSLELDPNGQYAYLFVVDFGRPQTDPGNPYTVDNGFQVLSELRMPGWPPSPHLDPPADDAPRGTLDGFPFRSEILDNTREIKVWRPAGYGRDPEQRYPVLVVNHGDNLLRGGLMQNTLDNLVGKTVAPLIAVFVPRTNPPEYGGPQVDDYLRFLSDELLPHIDRHYLTDPDRRAIMGPGSAGVTAVYAAFARPDVFRMAATQSFYPIEPVQERLPGLISGTGEKPDLIYVVWSRRDYDLGGGRKADEASRELLDELRGAGIEAIEQVADYSPGWGGWRGQDDEILAALFPMPAGD
jgi:outer membrane protein assembly factor BamB/enterochelin esterase-like enzyme